MENAYSIEKEKLQKMEDEIETQKDAFLRILSLKDQKEVYSEAEDQDEILIHGIKVDKDVFAFKALILDK